MDNKEFRLKVSPRMLELLSKDLYTNMYFVLAELIANSYDADAENVYVYIDSHEIRVEDDGNGMSPDNLDEKYLVVGGESRDSEENAKTLGKDRLKMGRKGIGKLAALSISDGFKLVTVQNCQPVAVFIPPRIEHDDEVLRVLNKEEYTLKRITEHGTAVIMEKPKVELPKMQATVMRNLAKIFPNDISDFKIHIIFEGKEEELIPDEKDVMDRLATFISIGEEKRYLENCLPINEPSFKKDHLDEFSETIEMRDSNNQKRKITVKIYGWIGTYKTTKNMKRDIHEFSDNYLAIFAHNKMGLRNVLPIIGKNRMYESYIVGNLYIDAFESPDFPDMAGTNRQGYNENDPRWLTALKYIRESTDKAVRLHEQFASAERAFRDAAKEEKKAQEEVELKRQLESTTKSIVDNLSSKLEGISDPKKIASAVSAEVEAMKPLLGFKSVVDANKKRIMISQTFKDRHVANVIYNMLLFNGVPKEDIIYSNGPDPETNLPENDIYGYLQKFFINSASTEMIYVLFVTSKNVINLDPDDPAASWGELMEIGAAWVTKKDHWIFNIDGFKPEEPLNVKNKLVDIYLLDSEDGNPPILSLSEAAANSFCIKIIETCMACGYSPKDFDSNKKQLINNYIKVC